MGLTLKILNHIGSEYFLFSDWSQSEHCRLWVGPWYLGVWCCPSTFGQTPSHCLWGKRQLHKSSYQRILRTRSVYGPEIILQWFNSNWFIGLAIRMQMLPLVLLMMLDSMIKSTLSPYSCWSELLTLMYPLDFCNIHWSSRVRCWGNDSEGEEISTSPWHFWWRNLNVGQVFNSLEDVQTWKEKQGHHHASILL